ncbi:MAG: hypothetical protein KDC91_08145 [Flavobacteriaceae bacterium]|nr:hypothetical protein [Flavobacteriaceae bacterium]
MKLFTAVPLLFLSCLPFYAQVGIGTTTPNPSSILEVSATNKGILIPKVSLANVTTTQLDGINTAATGLLIYNTNATTVGGNGVGYYYFNGAQWEKMLSTSSISQDNDWFEEGTTQAPPDINSNMYTLGNTAFGKNMATYRLDVEETTGSRAINALISGSSAGVKYAGYFSNQNNGNSSQYGLYSQVSGTGNGFHFGSYNNINSGGSGGHYAIYNNLQGAGTGTLRGLENYISSTTASETTGIYNTFSASNANDTGITNEFNVASTGDKKGINNLFNTSGNSNNYGLYTNFNGVSGNGYQYGTYSAFGSNASGIKMGNKNLFNGNGVGNIYGVENDIQGSNAGSIIGVNNILQVTNTSGNQIGLANSMLGTSTGAITGVSNFINNTSTTTHTGIINILLGNNTNTARGTANGIGGAGNGFMTGTINEVYNLGNGRHMGVLNLLSGTGSGRKFASYNLIDPAAGGTHYGVYSSVLNASGFAGYFAGTVAIGTSDENDPSPNYYRMPASRGTNGQVMQTDGSGNVSWVAPAAASQPVAIKLGTSLNLTGFVNNTEKALNFNTTEYNTGGGSYSIPTGAYTIPYTGIYSVTANFNVSFFGASVTQMVLMFRIYKNGVLFQQIAVGNSATLGTTYPYQNFSFANDLSVNAGDTLSFRIVPLWSGTLPAPSITTTNTHIFVKKI